jgi:hypothetical protein
MLLAPQACLDVDRSRTRVGTDRTSVVLMPGRINSAPLENAQEVGSVGGGDDAVTQTVHELAGMGWPSTSHRLPKCCWQALRSGSVTYFHFAMNCWGLIPCLP